ncbi:DNA-binding response regulator [Agrilactobacillus composti DSM 18527 = JCM 14202]|uniref:response regulator transcription factor n=1 Tax=Agrilactobacillus composti TaxID=398555 RepID=UPI00042DE820|nr:response regulator [Agrilactobacillus composti]GAF38336.1 DNA-binding response regulator [Agrilactobacillus composti DSM 18527 = JCM 14202]
MATILIVEDDQDLNHTVTTFLRQHDFQVYGALSAEAAYDLMYKHQFDLIISDIMMPDVDGFEFAETVRKLNENIPIIFMTLETISAPNNGAFALVLTTTWSNPLI